MKPGATSRPDASKTSALFAELNLPGAPTSVIWSPSSNRSRAASVLDAGSRTRPFLISSIVLRVPLLWNGFRRLVVLLRAISGATVVSYRLRCGGMRGLFACDEQVKNGHANRDAIGDLFEDAGLRAVGDIGSDFNA